MSKEPKQNLSKHPDFKYKVKSEYVQTKYHEPVEPKPFTTRIMSSSTESFEVSRKVKDSSKIHLLLGILPVARTITYKYITETKTETQYFCEITPEMAAWIESMKPYLHENFRSRGMIYFIPTAEEIKNKTDFQVYPVIVETGKVSGVSWNRYKPKENLPGA